MPVRTKSQLLVEVDALQQRVHVLEQQLHDSPDSITAVQRGEGFALLNNMRDGVVIFRPSSHERLFVNDAFVALNGYADRAEAIADARRSRVHPDDVQHGLSGSIHDNAPKGLAGYRLLWPDGTIKHVNSTRSNITFASEPAQLVVMRDVSELEESQRALGATEDRIRAMFNFAPVGIAFLDSAMRFLTANQALQTMLGRAETELTAHQIKEFVALQDRANENLSAQLLSGERDLIVRERRMTASSGPAIWTKQTLTAVRDADANVSFVVAVIEDVTADKLADEERREREERFHRLFEHSPIGISLTGRDRLIQQSNLALQQMLGRTADELEGRRLTDFWYPGHKQQRGGSHESLVSGNADEVQYERLMQRADGEGVWVEITATASRDDDGEVRQIIRMIRDVTAQKKAEQDLAEQQEQYRAVVDNMADGVVIFRDDKRLFVNQAFVEIYGYADREAALAEPVFERTHPDDQERVADFGQTDSVAREHTQVRISRPDGEVRTIEGSRFSIMYRGQPARTSVLRDVTEADRARQQMEDSEQRFRRLFEYSPIGIALSGTNREIKQSNTALQQMLGRSEAELLGAQLVDFRYPGHKQDSGSRDALTDGTAEQMNYERLLQRASGEPLWVEVTATAIRDEDGVTRNIFRMIQDVTARKLAEQRLLEQQEQYRTVVDNMSEGVVVHQAGKRIFVNQAFVDIYGYSDRGAALADSPFQGVEDRDLIEELASTDTGPGESSHVNIRRPNGEVRVVEGSRFSMAYRGEKARTSVLRDITDADRGRQLLEASEERFRNLFDSVPIGIAMLNVEGKINEANRSLAHILQRTQDELRGTQFSDFVAPGGSPTGSTRARMIESGIDYADGEVDYIRTDGARIVGFHRTYAVRNQDGQVSSFIRTLEDITERKQAEHELAASEQRFRMLFQQAPVGILIAGKAPGIQESNPALQQMLGYGEEQLAGTRLGAYWYPGFDQTPPGSDISDVRTGDKESFVEDRLLQRSDGSALWATSTGFAIRDQAGEISEVVAILEDTTERKRAEETLREREEQYRAVVENMVEGVAVVSQVWGQRPLFANQAFAELFGYPNQTDIPSDISERIHSEDRVALQERAKAPEIPAEQARFRIYLPDGSERVARSTRTNVMYSGQQASLIVARDITEEDKAIRALADSEARYSRLSREYELTLHSAADGIIAVDGAGIVRSANPSALRIVGLTEQEFVGSEGRAQFTLLKPDGAPIPYEERVSTVARQTGEEAYDPHLVIERPDRSRVAVEVIASPMRDGDTGDGGVVVVLSDITKRKRAEATLREREEQYRAVVENMVEGVAVVGSEWGEQPLFANRAYAKLFGYEDREEIAPATFNDRIHPEDRQALKERASWPVGPSEPARFRIQLPNGSERVARSTRTNVTFSGERASLIVARDITEEEAGVRALQESEARYARLSHENELILRSAADGIAAFDRDGIVVSANLSALQITGLKEDEYVGTTGNLMRSLRPDGTPLGIENNPSAIAHRTGDVAYDPHIILVRPNGSRVSIEVTATPLRDDNGEFAGVVLVFTDIGERLKIEQMKDELVSTVSHELRTPLTAIRAAVALVASNALGDLTPEAQRMLDIASTNSDRLTRLINDILDLERLDAGTLLMEVHECDAELVVRQAVQAVDALAKESNIEVTVQTADIKFIGDADRIIQVLTNLLANAIKFSPDGSQVTVTAGIEGGLLRFDIADHGRGIPEAMLETIFDRFAQVESSDSGNRNGVGLGLAISQRIVAGHEGRIWVDSELGRGSTFSFTLPQA